VRHWAERVPIHLLSSEVVRKEPSGRGDTTPINRRWQSPSSSSTDVRDELLEMRRHSPSSSARRVQPEWPEALEAGFAPGIRHPEGAKPCYSVNRFRLPLRVDLEVPGRGSNGGVTAVVQDHQPARANQLAQVEVINEDVVKDVAAIDESRVGDQALTQKAGQNDLGSVLQEGTEASEACFDNGVSPRIVELLLIGVDDHVAGSVRPDGNERFCDG